LRTYELVTIFTPETLDDAVPESTERVHKLILNKGGAIGRIQRWGKRRLSYPINHHTEGHYVLTNFEMEPTEMSTLDSELQVSEEILRHMIVRVDEEVLKAEIAAGEAAAARQAEQAAARAAAQAESEKAREAEATVAAESATATAEEAPAATEEEPATAEAKVETVAADAAPVETDDSEGGSPTESETPTARDEPETEEPAEENGDESESKGAS
jgi:small subunit ribosomal protein S6